MRSHGTIQNPLPVSIFQGRRGHITIAIAAAVLLGYAGYTRWVKTHVATVDPTTLATEISATSCADSGYRIKPAAGGWLEIYDCAMPSGRTICVTKTNGIASNATIETQAAFYGALGGNKPSCLNS